MTRTSPLDAVHCRSDARLGEFGGWTLPMSFEGTVAEHLACRRDAALFDVSHLGTVEVTGEDALDTLQHTLTNDLGRIAPGRAQYTHLLDPSDASVTDDIIVWWLPDGRFHVMPNASNTSGVLDAVGGVDVTERRALLAVQGPRARHRLAEVLPAAAEVGRFRVEVVMWRDSEITVAGTGYTGEDGVELAVPVDAAEEMWSALVGAGVTPAGLAARDTLRLEAGLPLHGHELGPGITPLQAGLGWVVRWDKGDFRGRAALEAERSAGVARTMVGVVGDGRRPLRDGATVLVDGEEVGTLTSGGYSPLLEQGIGLALVRPDLEEATEVVVELRGRETAATLRRPPFVSLPSEPA